MTAAHNTSKSRISSGIVIARSIVGLAFAFFGVMKLIGVPQLVAEFNTIGWGQWLRYTTGSIEVLGALLLGWPGRSAVGASILFVVSIGAFLAQLFVLHGDPVHTLVLAALTGWLAWTQRASLGHRRTW